MTDNCEKTKKRRGSGKPFAKGNDPRRNMAGAPRLGLSWSELIADVGNMTSEQARKFFGKRLERLKAYPNDVTLKELMVIQAYISLIDYFNPKVWTAMMDRSEGKLAQTINQNVTWKEEAIKRGIDPDALIKQLFGELAEVGAGSGDTRSVGTSEGKQEVNANKLAQDSPPKPD